MILGMLSKTIAISATSATNATASAGPFDMSGCNQVNIKVCHAAASATNASAKWATLQILNSDSTAFTSATAVSGLVGTTNATASTSQFVLGAHNNTSNMSVTKLNVLDNKHPYYFVVFSAATGYNTATIVVDGYAAAQAPNTASENGAAAIASVADTN